MPGGQIRIRVVVIPGGKGGVICRRLDKSDSCDGDGCIRPAQEVWPNLCIRRRNGAALA